MSCPIRAVVVSPLIVESGLVGTLQVFAGSVPAGLVRATTEVAGWVSGQLELAELADSRARLAEAEVRALRAQISPHFIYNALNAIASFVRTDPDRARDLLLDFADFTRYSFRRHGEYTTLEEELRSIERYLVLEQARFGDRLRMTLRIAPEVLSVAVPVLSLQPLVENAVRHGLADKPGGGRITILAEDLDREAVISDRGRRRRRGPRAGPPGARRRRVDGLDRPGERRRAAAVGVRRRLRPGGRDRARRRHPGHRPGAEVRRRGAAVTATLLTACSWSTTSDPPSTSWRSCSAGTTGSAR